MKRTLLAEFQELKVAKKKVPKAAKRVYATLALVLDRKKWAYLGLIGIENYFWFVDQN